MNTTNSAATSANSATAVLFARNGGNSAVQSALRVDAFAKKAAHALTAQAMQLPHDISERLRIARLNALSEYALAQRQHLAVTGTGGLVAWVLSALSKPAAAVQGGAAGLFNNAKFSGSASFLPLIALLAGLWLAQQQSDTARISEIATVDAALLVDELPPSAYADPGFAQFLRNAQANDLR